jgi:hypothetical protein
MTVFFSIFSCTDEGRRELDLTKMVFSSGELMEMRDEHGGLTRYGKM